jgi:hypothetical protein
MAAAKETDLSDSNFHEFSLTPTLLNIFSLQVSVYANARINCGVKLAAFLRLFAKKTTSLRSQI